MDQSAIAYPFGKSIPDWLLYTPNSVQSKRTRIHTEYGTEHSVLT